MTQKLSFWCPQFEGVDGGIQQFSRLFDHCLQQLPGVDSHTVTLGHLHGRAFQKASFVIRALGDALWRRPDKIICSHLHLARISPCLRALGIPYWICAHGIECWDIHSTADREALEKASRILCVSRYTEARILSAFPALKGRTRILPDHVDPPPAKKMDRTAARTLLDLPKDSTLLLTVSRLSQAERYKGHREMFQCFPQLLKVYPQLCHVIAGDGDDRTTLENLASEAGLAQRVFFLGHLDDTHLEAAYAACDYFVMPSTGEGFGIVFLEALVRGIPVLGGNRDGSNDPLQDGKCGILVDPASPEALTAGLLELLSRPWNREQLARQTWEVFGSPRLQERLGRFLEEG
jgi:phosphatidyl-myo-inositol dimannoside synthase